MPDDNVHTIAKVNINMKNVLGLLNLFLSIYMHTFMCTAQNKQSF